MIGGLYHLKKINKKTASTPKNIPMTSSGFTVVETLIVLAITGVMFVAIIGIVSGRQSKTQFNQAANNITAEIEQIISEVQSGYYPDTGDGLQGTRKDKMTLGKLMVFKHDQDYYTIDTLIGKRYAVDFRDAEPHIDASKTQRQSLKFGLDLQWMKYDGYEINGFAIVSGFGADADSGAMYGSQSAYVLPITSQVVDDATLLQSFDDRNPAVPVLACFDGGTGYSALITIGGANRVNTVALAIKNGDNCDD